MSVIKETMRTDASNAVPRARSISEARVPLSRERKKEKERERGRIWNPPASPNGIVSRNSKAARHAVTRCNANLCFSFSRIFSRMQKSIRGFFYLAFFFGEVQTALPICSSDAHSREHSHIERTVALPCVFTRNTPLKASQFFP